MKYESPQKIIEFNDLKAWQAAYKLTLEVYLYSKLFPKEELFGLTSQIRRSSSSIAANIAEGFGRQTYKEKVHYYYQAHGSLTETKNHILIAKGLQFISEENSKILMQQASETQALLKGLLKSTRSKIPQIASR